jgi:hypothetical protein
VKYKKGDENSKVQNQPSLTKYTLKRLSDRAKYDLGKGMKSEKEEGHDPGKAKVRFLTSNQRNDEKRKHVHSNLQSDIIENRLFAHVEYCHDENVFHTGSLTCRLRSLSVLAKRFTFNIEIVQRVPLLLLSICLNVC